ncbi:MAG: hypothetical protein U0325_10160 [Polyangiales bacterium]
MKPARAALLLALLCAPTAANAQGDPAAQEEALVREGVELRRQGHDEAAAAVLRRAFALRGSPRATGQLALAEQSLGRWARAESLLRSALRAVDDPWVARNREVLAGALAVAEQHLATVEVLGGVDGSEVRVDDERVGTLPADRTLRVAAGSARVTCVTPDGVVTTRVLELAPRAVGRVSFPDVTAAPAPARPPLLPPAPRVDVAHAAPPRRLHPVLWTGLTITSLAATALTAMWAVGESQSTSYDSDCVRAPRPDVGACDARRRETQASLNTLGDATDVAWVVLGAGVIYPGVGVVLTLVAPRASRPSVALGATPRGVALLGHF